MRSNLIGKRGMLIGSSFEKCWIVFRGMVLCMLSIRSRLGRLLSGGLCMMLWKYCSLVGGRDLGGIMGGVVWGCSGGVF